MFYWMRLFPLLAYYVKLIQQTLYDAMPFMVMVFIIVMAFSTFIYVANNGLLMYQDPNNEKGFFHGGEIDESVHVYYPEYFGSGVADVLTSIYQLGALGSFDSSLYKASSSLQSAVLHAHNCVSRFLNFRNMNLSSRY